MQFYVGSYTQNGHPGITVCSLEDWQLEIINHYALPDAISLIVNKEGSHLYAVSSEAEDDNGGSVASYAVEGGTLRLLSQSAVGGTAPCHLCLSEDEHFLYTANYMSGCVSVVQIGDKGEVGERIQHIQHQGKSIHPQRQTGPHTHQALFMPHSQFLCVTDLGADALITYKQDKKTGLLTFHDRLNTEPGFGPRHMTFTEDGNTAFLVHELANQVSVLHRNNNGWHICQTLPTLPPDFHKKNTAAAIRLAANESKLFVSNRGHDSIAVYDVEPSAMIKLIDIYATGGSTPRDIDLIDNETMLIAHQEGDVRLVRLDTAEGLTSLCVLPVPGAVCICL